LHRNIKGQLLVRPVVLHQTRYFGGPFLPTGRD